MVLLLRVTQKLLKLNNRFLALFTALFVLVSSTIMYALEPETFTTWFNALWYVMTTMATVGYGDYFPTTVPGKLYAMFLYLFGIGLLSLVIGKLLEFFGTLKKRKEAGTLKFHGNGHVLIIGWSRKAQAALDELLHAEPDLEVVVVDDLERTPVDRERVHFVSGDPAAEETLETAGLARARAAIVFSDRSIDNPALADGKALLVASSIERLAPHIHTTVEIVLEQHIQNFRHVQVNEFILSDEAVSRLAVRSALHAGSVSLLTQLLSRRIGEDVFEVASRAEWRTYGDAFQGLLRLGATLIADGSDMTINRKLDEPLPRDARLFIICDKPTYERIRGQA
ncbi:potassium channel protein [Paenibacillus sp.]|uniref:potassium channel protein n=1 Tax=Paenibacillus sp. TaxID=58172 RepID=UPI002D67A689|nr:ion channel [Paenibacillus sp.]HZG86463.1 ion channel [Paenibacillus sp.]